MKLPKLRDLIGPQMNIYSTPADVPLFVVGPPGSGKTTLAVLRSKNLSDQNIENKLVTHNRMLKSLAGRLGANATTMHRHVWREHSNRVGVEPPRKGEFVIDWSAVNQNYADKGLQPVLQHLVVDEGQNLPSGFFSWAVAHGANTLTVFADENQTTKDERSTLK